MLSSYQLSERYNAQSVLWACCRLSVAVGRKTAAMIRAALPWLLDLEALLMGAIGIMVFGLGLFAVVAAIPVTFWAGLIIVAAVGWATFPRKAVRP
jgi:hypothetical protein